MLQPKAEGHVQTLPRYSIGYTTYLILFIFFILLLSLSTRQRQELRYSRPAAVCGCFATAFPAAVRQAPIRQTARPCFGAASREDVYRNCDRQHRDGGSPTSHHRRAPPNLG